MLNKNLNDDTSIIKELIFEEWKPNVFYIDIKDYARTVEDAFINGKEGIYISNGEGVHAYVGDKVFDYDLAKELNVLPVELNYVGGTILGSCKDLSIIIVFPRIMDVDHEFIISNITNIISKYVPNTTYNGNDILVDDKKVSGSMMRQNEVSTIWAAQISFEDYSKYIAKLCYKPPIKKPSYIDSNLITRDDLEHEILNWLRKE